jgi:polyhydroxybutyrate depolymerase
MTWLSQVVRPALLGGLIMAAIGLTGCLVPGYAPLLKKPALSSTIQKTDIRCRGMTREVLFYAPQHRPEPAPLVIALHASMQTGRMMRVSTGYQFERLADEHGFVVVYPNGYGRHWNDCRKRALYLARQHDVDEEGFILAMIDHFQGTLGIDPTRVFAVGYSNGAHLVYRLALEMPDHITAVAAIAANLPTDENCDCVKSGRPIPIMIMNGTSDPINPYRGGTVSIFGLGSRGAVLSARESADYFARVNGHREDPRLTRILDGRGRSSKSVELLDWRDEGKPDVTLVTIQGGGHVVPQPLYSAPLLMGRTSHLINGPEEIWRFFARQPPLPRNE